MQDQYNELKKSLLKTGYFIANNYLDSYIQLCLKNIFTAKEKGKTNLHHTIPLAWYIKKYNLKNRKEAEPYAKNDESNLLINLLFKDHILAHYYLCLCSAKKFKYQAICALNYLLGNARKIYNLDTIQQIAYDLDLDLYQKLYEEHTKLNAKIHTGIKQNRTAEWNNKISKANIGKIKINKDGIEKAIYKDELQKYQNLGWQIGSVSTEERKATAKENVKKATKAASIANTGENNPAKRPEVRAKISKALSGRKLSDSTKQKISETKLKQRKAKIIINGISYCGIQDAMKKLHISFYKLKALITEANSDETK